LLVEPVATTAAPIRAFLEENDFLVDVVSSTREARGSEMKPYAVIIVDVRRDDREGLLFVQWLHKEHSFLVGRVVVISADDADALAGDLTELGVCNVVPKPVNAQEILRAVLECLEKSPAFSVQ
jgi:DNA-binding response OmpR family regulator